MQQSRHFAEVTSEMCLHFLFWIDWYRSWMSHFLQSACWVCGWDCSGTHCWGTSLWASHWLCRVNPRAHLPLPWRWGALWRWTLSKWHYCEENGTYNAVFSDDSSTKESLDGGVSLLSQTHHMPVAITACLPQSTTHMRQANAKACYWITASLMSFSFLFFVITSQCIL